MPNINKYSTSTVIVISELLCTWRPPQPYDLLHGVVGLSGYCQQLISWPKHAEQRCGYRMCARHKLCAHEHCLSTHHLCHNLHKLLRPSRNMCLHQGNTRAIACACVHERLVAKIRMWIFSQSQYLIKRRPAQIAMSISCGPSKVMGTQASIAHGILHAPQILSHHMVDVPKVRCQLRGCIPHLQRHACESSWIGLQESIAGGQDVGDLQGKARALTAC